MNYVFFIFPAVGDDDDDDDPKYVCKKKEKRPRKENQSRMKRGHSLSFCSFVSPKL